MDAKTFIDKVASGDANDAKDLINDLLSSRAFEALEVKKIEIAQSLYNNGEEIEVQDTADTPMEDELLTQEDIQKTKEQIKSRLSKEEVEKLVESVKIVGRDADLDEEHFKLHVNGKREHFIHTNYENSHATDSKKEIHSQVKEQLPHLAPEHQKAVTDAVHASYRK
jgi:hypothetical protein